MADVAPAAQGASTDAMNQSLASQQELMNVNLKMNTAMAWLQSGLDMAKKIKG